MAGIYKYILVRCAAAYGIIVIYQVQVLCCETAYGVYVTNREITTVIAAQISSNSGSSTMNAYEPNSSIAQTTPQSSSYILLHWDRKSEMSHTQRKRHHHPGFERRTQGSEGQQPTCSPI